MSNPVPICLNLNPSLSKPQKPKQSSQWWLGSQRLWPVRTGANCCLLVAQLPDMGGSARGGAFALGSYHMGVVPLLIRHVKEKPKSKRFCCVVTSALHVQMLTPSSSTQLASAQYSPHCLRPSADHISQGLSFEGHARSFCMFRVGDWRSRVLGTSQNQDCWRH